MKAIKLSQYSTDEIVQTTLDVLKKGGLAVFPSDTVYGLLVDATSTEAVQKLIRFKNRPPGKAISVFVADPKMLESYVTVSAKQKALLERLLPGPFTIILPSRGLVCPLLESEKHTLGVRLPDYPLVNEVVARFGRPVTATSANLGGRRPHYSIESLLTELPQSKKKLIDLVVDGGALPRNKPSTILDLTAPQMKILRHGDIVFSQSKQLMSESPSQTQKIGEYILHKALEKAKNKPLVILLQGDLGSGKTIMVKGMAKVFGIERIISPTFVVYYEYEIDQKIRYNKFVHADLYNIEEAEEFKHLGLEGYLDEPTVLCIEWGEKIGELYEVLKKRAYVVQVKIESVDMKGRRVTVNL